MELTKQTSPAEVSLRGTTRFIMSEGAHLRFQNTDGEGNFLDEVVPADKRWSVNISLTVIEEDAA